jgi:hypothetical protein
MEPSWEEWARCAFKAQDQTTEALKIASEWEARYDKLLKDYNVLCLKTAKLFQDDIARQQGEIALRSLEE